MNKILFIMLIKAGRRRYSRQEMAIYASVTTESPSLMI
jgi:hypothetical protein